MSEEQNTEEITETTESTSVEGIEQSGEEPGQEAVKPQGKSNDNTVPYQRFKEVNEAKKAAEAKLAQAQQVFSPAADVKQPDNSEPQREQFASDVEYLKELGKWSGQQAFQEAKTKEEQQNREYQEQQRRSQAETNFAQKATEAQKKYTNFNEALAASTVTFSDPVSLAIQASPVAGDLAYALATNPTEAQRISSLPTNEALVALGTLSAQIPGSNGQPVKQSGMPSPISPVGTGKPSAGKSYSDDMSASDFNDAFPFSDLD